MVLGWPQAPEVVGADGFAVEGGDADAEAKEHALDLVVEALMDGEAAGGVCEELCDGGVRAGVFFFEGHACAEFF